MYVCSLFFFWYLCTKFNSNMLRKKITTMTVPQTPINKRSSPVSSTSTKPKFITRMLSLFRFKTEKNKHHYDPVDTNIMVPRACHKEENIDEEGTIMGNSSNGDDDYGRDGDGWIVDLKRAVKMLHFGNWDEKELAAVEIKRLLAVEVDSKRRRMVAEHGVILPLVAMVGSDVVARRRVAVRALVELANGSVTNTAVIIEAGILSTLPENISVFNEAAKQEFAQLLVSISALANTHFSLNSSRIITFTVSILESCSCPETKELCLNTLYNLSLVLENAGTFVSKGVVNTLIITVSTAKEESEKALMILANLVQTLIGRKAIENSPMTPEALIEILTLEDSPKCQELSSYILMILAHHSPSQRRKMSEAGIVQVVLELSLLGTPLAQKRASKLLQWLKDERYVGFGPHSGPKFGRLMSVGSSPRDGDGEEGDILMKKIVKQSLRKNLETITRRANRDSSKIKALLTSSSCKNLPY